MSEPATTNFQSGPVNLHDDGQPLRYEDAAKRVSVEGWACVKCGRFYGEGDGNGGERSARYCCHTEGPCPNAGQPGCEGRVTRHRVSCPSCWRKAQAERYAKLIQEERAAAPSPESPLSMLDGDTYFWDHDDVSNYCIEHGRKPSQLMLVYCKPHNPPEFSLEDYLVDHLPEDGDLRGSGEEINAVNMAVNNYIKKYSPFSWYPDFERRPTDAMLAKWDRQYESDDEPAAETAS